MDTYADAVLVTPSDGSNLPQLPCKGLVAKVAGDLEVITYAEFKKTQTIPGYTPVPVVISIAAGVPLPLMCARVRAAGTTATGIFALY